MLLVASALEGFTRELRHQLRAGDFDKAVRAARKLSARRIALVLTETAALDVERFLPMLGWDLAGAVADYMPVPFAARILKELQVDPAGSLLAHMSPQNIVQVLPLLGDDLAAELLAQLDADYRARVEQLGRYDEGSAGAVMSTEYLAVSQGVTAREAISAVREAPANIDTTAYVYVVDPAEKLLGVISLRDLLLASPDTPIETLMHGEVLAARTDETAFAAAQRMRSRRFKLLPVVTADDVLAGVITMETAIELLEQDIAEDFVGVSGASVDESFFTPPNQTIRMRLPWMAANIFLNLGAVWVISSFESLIVQVAILAAFLPMITDMGGNVGIQALSVSIRSMALGEARLRDIWKALRKEVLVGICNGLALGALFGTVAYVLQGNLVLSLVAGIALAMNVLVAGVVGGTIPFLIKRLGKDPAMMTGPVLTTITDITGVSIYLGLSALFLASLLASGV